MKAVAIFLFLGLWIVAAKGIECDESLFLEYQECGTACPLECGKEPAEVCTKQCVEGCFCMEGYCLNEEGNCELDKSCGGTPNKTYEECGTACPLKCGEPPAEMCIAMCVEGCFCDEGYCLNDDGSCSEVKVDVEVSNDKSCDESLFLEYQECGTACPLECGKEPAEMCTMQCVEGCFCMEGYCKDPATDTCQPVPMEMKMVVVDNATSSCDESLFLEYQECGTACPLQCGEEPAEMCTTQCVEGCFCMDGYCEEKDGSCSVVVETKAKAMTMEEGTDPSSGAITAYTHMGVAGIVASMLVL